MLGIGLQIGRAVGWRRLVPLIGVAIIAGGLAREWLAHDKPAPDSSDDDSTGD
jgi:hypothetical protein